MQEIIPLSFTEIKAMVDAIIKWLKEFFAAAEAMFDGISYTYAGYPKTEENEKPV